MHLKSLTIKGFKSFAEPTTLEFEPGVTCVVGPNGSGKSNVVDALSWVMGEQGAKSLRGGSMEDVIFAGTQSRGPLGRAEVSLTIDNTDGALPIDYTEVTISRTLFRSGASEYAINREPCRLLDVQELLSDTGLGREMHVIVGQGQLDRILYATAEDRRRFIEEAAGILKHRRRKEKSLRKLEGMEANITRLQDLLAEIRRQLKPLGRQAEVAKQAQQIQAAVRDAKARLLADDVWSLRAALTEFSQAEGDAAAERTVVQQELGRVSAERESAESTLVTSEFERIRSRDFDLRRIAERIASLHALARERVNLLGQAEVLSELVSDVTEDQIASQQLQIEQSQRLLADAEEALGLLSAQSATAKAAVEAHDESERIARSAWDQWRLRQAAKQEALAVAKSRLQAAEAERDRTTLALAEAEARLTEAESRWSEISGGEGNPTEHLIREADQALQDAWAAESEASGQVEAARAELHRMERERDALAATLQALSLSLSASHSDDHIVGKTGVRGRVAELISITPGFETAIARALGALADALLVESRAVAYDLSQSVSGTEQGQLTMVVNRGANTVEKFALEGLTPAREVVDAPEGIARVLERTFIASSLDEVKRYWLGREDLPADVHIVTIAGDFFSPGLVHTGAGSTRSTVELRAEADHAKTSLEKVSVELERHGATVAKAQEVWEKAQEHSRECLAALRSAESQAAQHSEALSGQQATLDAARAERERLGLRLEAANRECEEASATVVESELALDDGTDAPPSQMDETLRDSLTESWEQARAAELEARLGLENARAAVVREMENLDALHARKRAREEQAEREAERQRERAALHRAAVEVSGLTPLLVQAAQDAVDASAAELAAVEHARRAAEESLVSLRSREDQLRSRLAEMTESVHSIEMQRYERNLHLGQLLERAQDELGLAEEVLLYEYGPDQPVLVVGEDGDTTTREFDRADQQRRLAKATSQLDALGRVNPLALEEFDAVEKRHQFLAEQLDDVLASRKDLLAIIDDLDDTMRDVFLEAFSDTQKAFDEVFPILFPGGQGSLSLSSPDDLLATGVEVAVRPKGKKIERLSLLSGGERSLAAVALLIAIFIARPSPFYILDEVEAALDDANLGRLLEVMERLRSDSQLIIITHQKRTMEIADALYGVSMRDDGVSAVVGQRVRDEAVA